MGANDDRVIHPLLLFVAVIALAAFSVTFDRNRGRAWRATAESALLTTLPTCLVGLPLAFPSSRGVVKVAMLVSIAGALLIIIAKSRKR